MTLMELQDILGQRIQIANDASIAADVKQKENEVSQTIVALAKQMINNADVVLRADKLISEGKLQDASIRKLVDNLE
jgi:hypothetical protein